MALSTSRTDTPRFVRESVLHVAAAGGSVDDVVRGIRELPVRSLLLVHLWEHRDRVEEVLRRLRPVGLTVDVQVVDQEPAGAMLRILAESSRRIPTEFSEIHVNVSSGPRVLGCASLVAAVAHGARAFHVTPSGPEFFPLLRLSYAEVLSQPKLDILRAIAHSGGRVESLAVLAARTGMEKSLLSYHIRGSREGKGLEALGLVQLDRGTRGRLAVCLTGTGRALAVLGPGAPLSLDP